MPSPSLPAVRCLTRAQAAAYLGIGLTLFEALLIPAGRFGRRVVYDRLDLDRWLEDYKGRGRARKETLWPVNEASTGDGIPVTGGPMSYYPTEDAYAEALRPRRGAKQKRSSPSSKAKPTSKANSV